MLAANQMYAIFKHKVLTIYRYASSKSNVWSNI